MGWQPPPGRVVVVVPPPPDGRSAPMAVRQLSMTPSRVVMSPAVGACPREQSVAAASLPMEAVNLDFTPEVHVGSTTFPAAVFESQPSSPESFLPIAASIFPSHLLAVRGLVAFPIAVLVALSQLSMSV